MDEMEEYRDRIERRYEERRKAERRQHDRRAPEVEPTKPWDVTWLLMTVLFAVAYLLLQLNK